MAGEFSFVIIQYISCFQTKGKGKKEREKPASHFKISYWVFLLKTYKKKEGKGEVRKF